MRVITPELLWHGGGHENGKPDPVFSIDLNYHDILATAGIDSSIPPKGSVRLWHYDRSTDKHDFIADLNDHQSSVNVVRFSPCAKYLASASDRQIVIYSVAEGQSWSSAYESRSIERIWLRPCLSEIYDLSWSPDSTYIVACSIDQKAEIIRFLTRDSIMLLGHTSYVQGVAWDPKNQMIVTQSADRSIKVHMLKVKPGMPLKLANRGHTVVKMLDSQTLNNQSGDKLTIGSSTATNTTPVPALSAEDFDPLLNQQKSKNLYADSTVPCFFRRPSFSPDGLLLVTPTGIYRNSKTKQQSFCTHIYSRSYLNAPLISLIGLEDPSVAIRFSPILYKPIIVVMKNSGNTNTNNSQDISNMMIPGSYRMIFAVITVSSILIYDTQHPHPIARFGGLHLACINDATWSADGLSLLVCSSDGYISFIQFDSYELGIPLDPADIPSTVRAMYPHTYDPVEVTTSSQPPSTIIPSVTPITSTSSSHGTNDKNNTVNNRSNVKSVSEVKIIPLTIDNVFKICNETTSITIANDTVNQLIDNSITHIDNKDVITLEDSNIIVPPDLTANTILVNTDVHKDINPDSSTNKRRRRVQFVTLQTHTDITDTNKTTITTNTNDTLVAQSDDNNMDTNIDINVENQVITDIDTQGRHATVVKETDIDTTTTSNIITPDANIASDNAYIGHIGSVPTTNTTMKIKKRITPITLSSTASSSSSSSSNSSSSSCSSTQL